jgi:hypothetical protein
LTLKGCIRFRLKPVFRKFYGCFCQYYIPGSIFTKARRHERRRKSKLCIRLNVGWYSVVVKNTSDMSLYHHVLCISVLRSSVTVLILDLTKILRLCLRSLVCLFVCLFRVARAVFQLSGDCHHCRRQGCKFRPMLSAYGF